MARTLTIVITLYDDAEFKADTERLSREVTEVLDLSEDVDTFQIVKE